MRIVLWDIDGTLVNTGGAGVRALGGAVQASVGATDALARMRLDGMTDRRIARLLCAARQHRDTPEEPIELLEARVTGAEIDAVLALYLRGLATSLATAEGYRVLPGVRELLDALEGAVVHALGTGNIEAGARLKLEHGGLWHRFAFGGFGSDAEERPEILRAARRKAQAQLGRSLEAEELVVVGDTPKDIAAAHEAGLCCVAVASGRHEVHELAQAGADDVLASLDVPDAAERILKARRQ